MGTNEVTPSWGMLGCLADANENKIVFDIRSPDDDAPKSCGCATTRQQPVHWQRMLKCYTTSADVFVYLCLKSKHWERTADVSRSKPSLVQNLRPGYLIQK